MHRIKELEKLHKLHLLIKNECTGSPKLIAKQMQISNRTVHRLLEKLRDYGAEICFDRKRNTYHYCDVFDLKVSVKVKIINKNHFL